MDFSINRGKMSADSLKETIMDRGVLWKTKLQLLKDHLPALK